MYTGKSFIILSDNGQQIDGIVNGKIVHVHINYKEKVVNYYDDTEDHLEVSVK